MADWRELRTLSKEELMKVKYNDPRLDSFATEVEARYGLPPGLIEAVKNAGERSNTNQVSGKGAKGVMQFMDSTRKLYPHDYKNPLESIDAAGQYFADLSKQYNGNAKAMIFHYNGGTSAGKLGMKGEKAPTDETNNYWSRLQDYMKKKEETAKPVEPVKPAEESLMDKVKRVAPPAVGGGGELVSDVFK